MINSAIKPGDRVLCTDGAVRTVKNVTVDKRAYYVFENTYRWDPDEILEILPEFIIGDVIKIADKKIGDLWNPQGKMDVWLGKHMTVTELRKLHWGRMYRMAEDNGLWSWFPHMIDSICRAGYTEPDFMIESDEALMSFLSEGR